MKEMGPDATSERPNKGLTRCEKALCTVWPAIRMRFNGPSWLRDNAQ